MKKWFTRVALALCCMSVLTGCGKSEFNPDEAENEEKQTWVSTDDSKDTEITETSEYTDAEQEKEEVAWGKDSDVYGEYHDKIDWDNEQIKVCFIGYVKDHWVEDAEEVDNRVVMAYRMELPDELPMPASVELFFPSDNMRGYTSFSVTDYDCVRLRTADSGKTYVMDVYDDKDATEDAVKTLREVNDGRNYMDFTYTIPKYVYEDEGLDPEKCAVAVSFESSEVSDDILAKYDWASQDMGDRWTNHETDFLLSVPNTSWGDIYKPICIDLEDKNFNAGAFVEVDGNIYFINGRSSDSDYLDYLYKRIGIYTVDKDFEDMHTGVDMKTFTDRYEFHTLFIGDRRWMLNEYDVSPYIPWEDALNGRIDVSGTINERFEFVDEETFGPGHRIIYGYSVTDGGHISWVHNMGTTNTVESVIGLVFENEDGSRLYIF